MKVYEKMEAFVEAKGLRVVLLKKSAIVIPHEAKKETGVCLDMTEFNTWRKVIKFIVLFNEEAKKGVKVSARVSIDIEYAQSSVGKLPSNMLIAAAIKESLKKKMTVGNPISNNDFVLLLIFNILQKSGETVTQIDLVDYEAWERVRDEKSDLTDVLLQSLQCFDSKCRNYDHYCYVEPIN